MTEQEFFAELRELATQTKFYKASGYIRQECTGDCPILAVAKKCISERGPNTVPNVGNHLYGYAAHTIGLDEDLATLIARASDDRDCNLVHNSKNVNDFRKLVLDSCNMNEYTPDKYDTP